MRDIVLSNATEMSKSIRRDLVDFVAEHGYGEWIRTDASVRGGTVGGASDTFEGDLDSIDLLVQAAVSRIQPSDLQALTALAQGRVARTLERFESAGEVDREALVDIAISVLSPLRSNLDLSTIERAYGYLEQQEPSTRGYGFYITVLRLAQLAMRSPALEHSRLLTAGFLYHAGLAGMSTVLAQQPNDASRPSVRASVRVTTQNLAGMIQGLRRETKRTLTENGKGTIRDMIAIRVAWTREVESSADASAILAELGFSATATDETLAVPVLRALVDMGTAAVAWTTVETAVDTAFIEAASGVAASAIRDEDTVSARFFNAGVSLLAHAEGRTTLGVVRARFILNALGLYWSLAQSQSLAEAMTDRSGRDCVVNMLGALVDAQDARLMMPFSVFELISQLSGLPDYLVQLGETQEADAGRIRGSLRHLNATAERDEPHDLPELLSAVMKALAATSGDDESATGLPEVWSASLVSSCLRDISGVNVGALENEVLALLQRSNDPGVTLGSGYARFVIGALQPYGLGPLVAAEVVDMDEWVETCGRVARRVPSLARLLSGLRIQ